MIQGYSVRSILYRFISNSIKLNDFYIQLDVVNYITSQSIDCSSDAIGSVKIDQEMIKVLSLDPVEVNSDRVVVCVVFCYSQIMFCRTSDANYSTKRGIQYC